jgi:general secretion pathway protein H
MTKISTTGSKRSGLVQGFSLVELLVVLTIMSVLASSITYLMLNRQETFKMVVGDIVQKMRQTRQLSIRNDRPYQIQIDLGNNVLRFNEDLIELAEDIYVTVRTAQDQVIDDDIAGMTFYPDASSSGGVITLENEQEIYEISVIWISGKIQMRHQPVES